MIRTLALALLTVLPLAAGCAPRVRASDLSGIYNRAAAEHDPMRNPVIVIPGVLGSRLVHEPDGTVVWGAFGGGAVNPQKPGGARLVALPMGEHTALHGLADDVVPDGALDRVQVDLLGVPVRIKAYLGILGTLGVGGYRDEQLGEAGAIDYGDDHFTCFQFDYDWRRDNVENARRLYAFIAEKRALVQSELRARFGLDDADVKFDIVAHSMGGLLARYMLRYGDADLADDPASPRPVTWAGAEHVERVILVGTPNAGSVQALLELVEGVQFAFFLPRYEPAVLGTMPSLYQLLPRPRHAAVVTDEGALDILDPGVWEHMRWGLADPAQAAALEVLLPEIGDPEARRRVAIEHLGKCLRRAKAFFAALDAPAPTPPGLELSLVAGDAVPTPAVAAIGVAGRPTIVESRPGDGTVVRASALMDERMSGPWRRELETPIDWHHVTFLFSDHLRLTDDPAFTDNVLYQLLEEPRR